MMKAEKNQNYLIIPDIHHKWEQAEKIIASVGADEIIFLGDYFDDFDDTPDMVRATCEWLESSVIKPNRIHLFGNHDQMYAYPYKTFQCSGYAQWKSLIINDIVSRDTWNKLKWYHFLNNRWLLSHGGLHKLNVPQNVNKNYADRTKFIEDISEYLNHELLKGFRMAANNQSSWIFNAGRARWGQQRVGGITWCDFEREFFPIQGLNQIVGHTPQMQGPRWCILNNSPSNEDDKIVYRPHDVYKPTLSKLDDSRLSHNICLDVHGNMHWATWDGKELKVGNYKDL